MRSAALGPGLLVVAAVASAAAAQARNERQATVGMRARIEQVVLPGSELEPAPASAKSPVVVRMLAVWPHGEHRRYDLEWTGLEPGTFDLVQFLARRDGSPAAGLPPLVVEVRSVLPAGVNEPSELAPRPLERLGGYRTTQIAAAIAWGVGLLLILFVGRRFRRRAAAPQAPPTLADRLRPLVEAVAAGTADTAQKAELERLLVAYWRAQLDLRQAKAADALAAIRRHPEAGALLRRIEAWLHAPSPPAEGDLASLLLPYRSVTAASFEPPAPAGKTAEAS